MNRQPQASVALENGALVLYSSYDPGLVAAIKSLPYPERKWDAGRKAWMVDPKHGQSLIAWCAAFLGITIQLPKVTAVAKKETRLLEVRYVGQTKDRGNGERTAFGYSSGLWSVIFPEQVLRDWFEAGPAAPEQDASLYSLLGISQNANGDELKSAYRRMARQWHPDICKEIDATAVFQRINHAYEILSDSRKRAKYDAGLALEASMKHQPKRLDPQDLQFYPGYRAPLRCGWIMVLGTENLGRFVVEKIQAWEDITANGQTLVVSWPMGADQPLEEWV